MNAPKLIGPYIKNALLALTGTHGAIARRVFFQAEKAKRQEAREHKSDPTECIDTRLDQARQTARIWIAQEQFDEASE